MLLHPGITNPAVDTFFFIIIYLSLFLSQQEK